MNIDVRTLNAKRMSMESIVRSFVVPETFEQLTSSDHAFLIGPRGSGKTTLLKMLSSRFLNLWHQVDQNAANQTLDTLGFTGVFLPTDSLWTTQTHPSSRTFAFACQLLSSIVDAMQFRLERADASASDAGRFPVSLAPHEEVALVKELSEAWDVSVESYTLRSMSVALDRVLLNASEATPNSRISRDPFLMATHSIRAFNRLADQPDHRWCILIDELEIAPSEIVAHVMRVVRGGSGELILKASMSPSDHAKSGSVISSIGRPMPGHDFVPVHLSTQSQASRRTFTQELWHQTLTQAGIEPASVEESFGRSFQGFARDEGIVNPIREEFELALSWDRDFAQWFHDRELTLDKLDKMDYVGRSAVVRKLYPILVFRNGNHKATTQPEGWGRRSRKKEFEAFSGASQIIGALEGNPRWIKSAFRSMLPHVSVLNGQVDAPMQYSALLNVAQSFESFLRFVPSPDVSGKVLNDVSLIHFIDAIATAMHQAHVGRFSADPPGSFGIDDMTAERFGSAIDLGLYSGGIVHVRSGASSPILSDYSGQRFRLTYSLAVRPKASFPMRLGRPINLAGILARDEMFRAGGSGGVQMPLPLGDD